MDSKFTLIYRTFHSILADLNNAVVWMVSINIILPFWEFFMPALAGGFSMEFEGIFSVIWLISKMQ